MSRVMYVTMDPRGTRRCIDDALGTPLCSHALKHVCIQSNGMAERPGRGDVESLKAHPE